MAVGSPRIGCAKSCWRLFYEVWDDRSFGKTETVLNVWEVNRNIYPLLDNKRDGLKCGGNEGVAGGLKAWDVKMAVGSPRIGCARACWGLFYEV